MKIVATTLHESILKIALISHYTTTTVTDKYQNKYRIPSARLQSWDYSSNAAYFITICTTKREQYFGQITNGTMDLVEQGKKANQFWLEIPDHFSFVFLDEYVIMPNHMHGIIIIDKPDNIENLTGVETGHALSLQI